MKFKNSYLVILFGLLASVHLACNPWGEMKSEADTDASPASDEVAKEKTLENAQKPIVLSEEQFSQLVADFTTSKKQFKGSKPCIIDFYADWCRPCKMLAPLFEEMAGKYGDKIDFYKVDFDACPNISAAYKINIIPVLFFYDKNGAFHQKMGVPSEEELENILKTMLE